LHFIYSKVMSSKVNLNQKAARSNFTQSHKKVQNR
jgi:hypothetical protein